MKETEPNLILKNGSVYTVNKNRSWAQAVAIEGDRIIYVGSNEGVESYKGSKAIVLDLAGKMILPGFVEAHAHPSQAMDLVSNISLHALESLEEKEKT
jgi:predicted amidohydrolase YtcJ